jgi:DNA-binding protein H-NS
VRFSAPSIAPGTPPAYSRSSGPENARESQSEEESAFGNIGVAYSGAFSNLIAMARDSQTSASDVIHLLQGLTVADLNQVIAEAERQREARLESGKKELVEEFRAKAEAMGLSLEELLRSSSQSGRPAAKARQPQKGAPAASPAVKYRNPETGETWSGRGRSPKWMALAEQSGRSREEFLAKG